MIEGAERDGLISPGDTIVEYTGGSTGPARARLPGERVSRADCDGLLLHGRALPVDAGARRGGRRRPVRPGPPNVTSQDIHNMVARAAVLANEPGHYAADQFNNPYVIPARRDSLGREIWEESEGRVSAFCHGIGTGSSLMGVSDALKPHGVVIQGHEPAGSIVAGRGGPNGPLWVGENSNRTVLPRLGAGFERRRLRHSDPLTGTRSLSTQSDAQPPGRVDFDMSTKPVKSGHAPHASDRVVVEGSLRAGGLAWRGAGEAPEPCQVAEMRPRVSVTGWSAGAQIGRAVVPRRAIQPRRRPGIAGCTRAVTVGSVTLAAPVAVTRIPVMRARGLGREVVERRRILARVRREPGVRHFGVAFVEHCGRATIGTRGDQQLLVARLLHDQRMNRERRALPASCPASVGWERG